MASEIGICILHWNDFDLTDRCLSSLGPVASDFRILVVDNHSTDGSYDKLYEKYPNIEFLRNAENLGYAGGNNRGLEHLARGGESKYILILNNDAEVKNPRFIAALAKAMDANEKLAAAGPLVRFPSGRRQRTILNMPFTGRVFQDFLGLRFEKYDEPVHVEALSGCCLMLRTAVLREIGAFDEEMFCYFEEVDWEYRARMAGWSIGFVPIESILHHRGASAYRDPATRQNSLIMAKANQIYFLKKHGFHSTAGIVKKLIMANALLRVGLGKLTFSKIYTSEFLRKLKAEIKLKELSVPAKD